MNEPTPADNGLLPIPEVQLVDRACDRFEAAWKAGQRPRIEEALDGFSPAALPVLLRQLLLLDIEYRTHSGDSPSMDEYLGRFPDHAHVVQAVFSQEVPGPIAGETTSGSRTPGACGSIRSGIPGIPNVEILDLLGPGAGELQGPPAAPSDAAAGERSRTPLVTAQQFLDNLACSGLFSDEELSAVLASLPAPQYYGNASELACELVRSSKLTGYQAQMICHGQLRGLVFGEYRVLDKLGEGGMGVVLKAEHRRMKRLVAVKTIVGKSLGSPEAVKRFFREVEAAARLNHPNIVQAYDAFERDGVHYLVMEYVDGKDLGAIVKEKGPLPIAEALDYVVQAARGLQYAHKQRIVHRDVKPSNLLVGEDGTVKILDMGLALIAVSALPADQDRLTNTGQLMGTWDYMAPEQAWDTHGADARADIYSLGCTLYRVLTGCVLFVGRGPAQIIVAHEQAPIPSLSNVRSDVPPQLDALFRKMVAKRPEDRQQSMAEVVEETERILAVVSGRPPGTVGARLPSSHAPLAAMETPVLKNVPLTIQTVGGQQKMPYEAEISRVNPTCFLFLVDQSGSMAESFGGDSGKTKAQGVAEAMNRLLQTLVFRCAKGGYILDRYYIGAIGYGGELSLGLPVPALAGEVLRPVSLIGNSPLRIEERVKTVEQPDTLLMERHHVSVPVWFEPKAKGKTLMCAALKAARSVLEGFVEKHPACYPPIVINISDGMPSDGDPRPFAAALRGVASQDGETLLFNIHISSRGEKPILFPSSESGLPDDQARLLFRMSSRLPPAMFRQAQITEASVADGAVGFAFHADLAAVVKFLDIGTRVYNRMA